MPSDDSKKESNKRPVSEAISPSHSRYPDDKRRSDNRYSAGPSSSSSTASSYIRSSKESRFHHGGYWDDDYRSGGGGGGALSGGAPSSGGASRRYGSGPPRHFSSSYINKDYPRRGDNYIPSLQRDRERSRERERERSREGPATSDSKHETKKFKPNDDTTNNNDTQTSTNTNHNDDDMTHDNDNEKPKKSINLRNIPKGPRAKVAAARIDKHPKKYDDYDRIIKKPAKYPHPPPRKDRYIPSYSKAYNGSVAKKFKDLDRPKDSSSPASPVYQRPAQINVTYYETTRESAIFERVSQVGEGTYGKVYKAKNKITGEYVALKRLRLEGEREGFPITAMREIRLLQSFNHPNVIGLLEMMIERKSIYMVFDYIDNDLTGILNHPDVQLTSSHCKYLLRQLIEGIEYLHSKRVIHRDIKGSNILIDSDGNIKIADFGLARRMKDVKPNESPDYTNRVITLWYRPPELLMGATDYGREVDIWGIGCLLIEIFNRRAIFQGTEEINQLESIFEIMGTPNIANWPDLDNLPWFELLRPKVKKPSKFKQLYANVLPTENCFSLAEKLLTMNPAKRISAKDALREPYFGEEPQPEPLTFLKNIGEWHELDAKRQRRKKKQEDKKRAETLAKQKNNKGEQGEEEVPVSVAKEEKDKTKISKNATHGRDPKDEQQQTVQVGASAKESKASTAAINEAIADDDRDSKAGDPMKDKEEQNDSSEEGREDVLMTADS